MKFNNLKRNKVDIVISLILVSSPFLFYLYRLAPKNLSVWHTMFFKIDAGSLEYVDYYLWFLSVKILTTVVLTLWFLTCKNNWRNFLTLPLGAEFFKFFVIINQTNLYWDSNYYLTFCISLCFSIPYVVFVNYLSFKFGYVKKHKDSSTSDLNNEINNQLLKLSKFNIKDFNSIKKQILKLRTQKDTLTKREYLAKLIALRDQLTLN